MEAIASTRSARSGRNAATRARNASTPSARPCVGSLGDQVGELVVVLAGQRKQGLAAAERRRNARDVAALAGMSRQPEPPHVERHPVFPGGQAAGAAQRRGPAVAGQRQVGVDLTGTVGTAVAHTGHPAVGDDEAGRLGAHAQPERRLPPGRPCEQVQQIPLRHHRHIVVRRRQRREDIDRHPLRIRAGQQHTGQPALRQFAKLRAQAELVQQRHRRRMHRVPAEIPQEIGVLLQHRHRDPRPRQQQPGHHPRRAAPGDHHRRRLDCTVP